LHARRDNLGASTVRGVVLPLSRAQPALHEDLPLFLEILVAGQCEFPDDYDPMPFRSFLALALLVEVSLSVATEKFTTGRPVGV